MKCISSPALGDAQIVSFIEGEAEAAVAAHMAECQYCAEKAERWSRLQNDLKAKLYRRSCPTSMELGDHHLGLLFGPQALLVAQHVRECPLCRREVHELEEYLKELAPQLGLLETVTVIIARLISGKGVDKEYGEFSSAPAFEGLRGDEDEPFIYQADHIQISIDIRDDTEQPGYKVLLGLITGLETKGFMIQARLVEEVVATAPVDEIGNFVIPLLVPGIYKLTLIGADIEIQIQSLPV